MSLNPSLGNLLQEYTLASMQSKRLAIEEKIWNDYGRTGAIFILDMSGFSRTTVTKGLIYYLALVRRMQLLVEPLILANKGTVVKYDADNAFAFFETTTSAVKTAVELNYLLKEENSKTPEELDILVSIGIDFGNFLHLPVANDFFGSAVNFACKLGEDIGEAGDILVTENAWETISDNSFNGELGAYQISGIAFKAYKVQY